MASESSAFDQARYDNAYPEDIQNHYWQQARNQFVLDACRRWQLKGIKTFMEIGAGRGFVTRYLRQTGIECWGCEIADVVLAKGAESYVFGGCSAQQVAKDLRDQVQCLLLFDVLEHIEHPREFLNDLLSSYPNTTVILVTVPARQELWSNFDEYYGHYKRYDLSSAESELVPANFKTGIIRYFFSLLYWMIQLNRRIQGNRSINLTSPVAFPMNHVHWAIGQLLYYETKILPAKAWGSSVFLEMLRKYD